MVAHFRILCPVFCSNFSFAGVQQFIFFSYAQFYSNFNKIFSFFRVWWLVLPSHAQFCSIIFLLRGYRDSIPLPTPILLTPAPALTPFPYLRASPPKSIYVFLTFPLRVNNKGKSYNFFFALFLYIFFLKSLFE